jgi:hypothetical protein
MVTDIVDTSFSGLASTGGLRSGCVLRQPRHPETPVCDVEDAAGSPASSRDCAASPHPASQAMRERAHEGAGGRRSRHDSIDVNRGAGNSLF